MDDAVWKQTWGEALNQQQAAAVQAADGPVLLLAVPGSGKTTVLIHRLGYLMDCRGIPPERILTVTYTVAATRDMRARFARTFGEDRASRLEFRTINGLSARIIQYYERAMGRRAFQLVTDEGTLSSLVGELFRACTGTFATESTIKGLRTAITYGKNRQMSREEMEALSTGELPVAQVYQAYCRVLRQRGWMDYDDQMVYAAQILRRHGEILAYFQEKYTHLCVDEAQDTSRIQHTILRLLAGRRRNLFLVGDEDQSIYGFRAAEPGALLRFERDYPGGRVLFLEKNYRSTQTIVTAADGFIRQNYNRRDKHMTAARGPGPALEELWVYDRAAQYAYLARLARDCPQETAVLYRNNESALPVLDLLDRQGIACRCRQMDGTFFTHRVVRDVADFFTFAVNPADGACFLRMYYKLRAGITKGAAQWAVRTVGAGEPAGCAVPMSRPVPVEQGPMPGPLRPLCPAAGGAGGLGRGPAPPRHGVWGVPEGAGRRPGQAGYFRGTGTPCAQFGGPSGPPGGTADAGAAGETGACTGADPLHHSRQQGVGIPTGDPDGCGGRTTALGGGAGGEEP